MLNIHHSLSSHIDKPEKCFAYQGDSSLDFTDIPHYCVSFFRSKVDMFYFNIYYKFSLISVWSHSNTNAKKWETELQTLRENNARLVDALQESSANVESWKKQLNVCKEESDTLRQKVRH